MEGQNARGSEASGSTYMLAAIQADVRLTGQWEAQAGCDAARARGLTVVQCDESGLTARRDGSSLSVRVLIDHILYSETFEESEPGYYATQDEAHTAAAHRWQRMRDHFEGDLVAFAEGAGLERASETEWRPVTAIGGS